MSNYVEVEIYFQVGLVIGEVVDINVAELLADSLDDVQEVTVGDVVQGEAGQLAELSPISKSSRQSSAPEICIRRDHDIAGHHLKEQIAPN